MAESWPKKLMPLYEIVGIFRDFLAHKFNYINLHILSLFQRNAFFSVDFMSKKTPKVAKKAISLFATSTQLQSPKKFHTFFNIFA